MRGVTLAAHQFVVQVRAIKPVNLGDRGRQFLAQKRHHLGTAPLRLHYFGDRARRNLTTTRQLSLGNALLIEQAAELNGKM
jgi:hypothetical protein